MDISTKLIKILADGKFHSGEDLGQQLGVSRTAIWKHIQQLKDDYHLTLDCVHGKGYCIPDGIELLDNTAIINALNSETKSQINLIDIYQTIDSTNHYALEKAKQQTPSGYVCLAEMQTAGRGRRQRSWFSPFGKNIYLSLLWSFQHGPQTLSGLTIAAGLAVIKALEEYGITDLGVKWPNDIYWQQKKLVGILAEMFTDSVGVYNIVLGIGINLGLPKDAEDNIDQPAVDIKTITGQQPQRNRLVGLVLNELVTMLSFFETEALSKFQQQWNRHDILYGKPVIVSTISGSYEGVAAGIDEFGGLKIKQGDNHQVFHSGEVSVRIK
jgi:BirA family biotin operon repressor/biotin-[acetyl-CoA-carboxylase] ligase